MVTWLKRRGGGEGEKGEKGEKEEKGRRRGNRARGCHWGEMGGNHERGNKWKKDVKLLVEKM
jgi:hypothetical protein